MINDILVEILDLMIDVCKNKQQAFGMESMREFICDYCESDWSPLSPEEKREKLKQYMN
ncbi:MAG: hypothetical protein LBI03_03770 [Clostridiales bacterium]|jgi:uncharacterized Zn ribbon protein|nr:hypothetical protein [Clostridiales bacterium]